jgi:hypothetical protein
MIRFWLSLVDHDVNGHVAFSGGDECVGDRFRREGVGGHQDFRFGRVDAADDLRFGASSG